MRCNPSRWLWGLIPVAMLSWGTFYREQPNVEADLAVRATEALNEAGQSWAKVTLTGREAVITGQAQKDGEPKAALDAVKSVWGIRTVQLKTDLAVAAPVPQTIGPQATAPDEAAASKAIDEAEAAAMQKAEEEAAAAAQKAQEEAEAVAALKAQAEVEAAAKQKAEEEAAAAARKAQEEAEAAAALKAQEEAEAAAMQKAEQEAAAVAQKAEEEAAAAAQKAQEEAEAAAALKAQEEAEAAAKQKAEEEAAAAAQAQREAEAAAAQKAKQEADMEAEARADAEAKAKQRKTTAETDRCEKRLSAAAAAGVILFDRASSDIHPKSAITIAKLAEIVKACPGARVEVEGHTDSEGEPDRNQKLSERRARAVVKSLVYAGVSADRLSAVGYGASRPVASNDTRDGMARNRRIEFKAYSE